ncbi:MAG TPA: DEAD/DEAH box helicase family protein [Flavobacteriales bacterium]|nr:DEAD/DEAH box helicase family protein [Flavobacteriales bacterium]
MELKPYQQRVIDDLDAYLEAFQRDGDPARTFNVFWEAKAGLYDPLTQKGMRPYQDNVPGAIHLCMKVPTAGGKTFLAVNALKTIFDRFNPDRPKAVVWLVPWSNLLQQTVRTLGSPEHPYNRKLQQLFQGRVEVYEKEQLLMGAGFNPTSVQEQLSIIVMSFASLRARRKADRKVYQENGQLDGFRSLYTADDVHKPDTDDTALINVIRHLNPVVVVDESHNAESDLSVEMLRDLNPSLILDLTATPKDNSNIVSLVPALELKKEHMVKLPVIVYNQHERSEVVQNALHLRQRLQDVADAERKAGGRYIRPIVLFQAQPRTGEENVTYEKLKQMLIKAGISEEEVKIKTAELDELKGIPDLMAEDCPVKYIITVNALKEGWDCPFAYILASLANRSSAVDVEQILGRVLRQPYVLRHRNPLLNMSYVLTASTKFYDTLQNIVHSLQQSGFSDKDYRAADARTPAQQEADKLAAVEQALLPVEAEEEVLADLEGMTFDPQAGTAPSADLDRIEEEALAKNAELEAEIAATGDDESDIFIQEMGDRVNSYAMRGDVAAMAKDIRLPKFVLKVPPSLFTGNEESWGLLGQETLLEGFRPSQLDLRIDWDSTEGELYAVDLEEGRANPAFQKILKSQVREPIMEYILAKPREAQVQDVADQILLRIGDMWPIADQEIKKYVTRLLENFDAERLRDVLARPLPYTRKIREKIQSLADEHAEQQFKDMLQVGKVRTERNWHFPDRIIPGRLGKSIRNSLYEREGDMNTLEERAAAELGSLPNIVAWHRNLGRGKGFSLNGFKNDHYPDFILLTKGGKVILIETKGDDRDNSDSRAKARLGRIWQDQAGPDFRYFMVFDTIHVEGAYTLAEAKRLVAEVE